MSTDKPNKGGRPPTPEDEKRSKPNISLSPDVMAAGKVLAKSQGISFSAFTEMAIREKLESSQIRPLRVGRRTLNPKKDKGDRA